MGGKLNVTIKTRFMTCAFLTSPLTPEADRFIGVQQLAIGHEWFCIPDVRDPAVRKAFRRRATGILNSASIHVCHGDYV
jgi:hypothetical protein